MPFNFPASPTIGQQSVQNGRNYQWTGSAWEIVTVYTDFSSNVNALLPVIANNADNRVLTGTGSTTGISAENNLTFDGSLLNVAGSGSFSNNVVASGFVRSGGTSSQFLKADGSVDSTSYQPLLTNPVTGVGTSGYLSRWNGTNSLTSGIIYDTGSRIGIGTTSPSGQLHVIGSGLIASVAGTSPNSLFHLYSATSGASIFNVEGTNGSLFSVDDNLSSTLMSVNNNAGLPVFEVFSDDRVVGGRFNQNDFVINSSGNIGVGNGGDNSYKLNVTGNVNVSGTINISGVPLGEFIDDEVAGLLVAGSGISLNYNDTNNLLTISTSGLQPSGNYSVVGHTHTSSSITDFNSSVSGLLPTISNSGDNRVLTSTGTNTGIDAENNLTFDGSLLNVVGSGNFNNIFVSGVALNEVIDDEVAGLLVAGSGINLNHNDSGNTLTVSASTNIINSANLYLWSNFK